MLKTGQEIKGSLCQSLDVTGWTASVSITVSLCMYQAPQPTLKPGPVCAEGRGKWRMLDQLDLNTSGWLDVEVLHLWWWDVHHRTVCTESVNLARLGQSGSRDGQINLEVYWYLILWCFIKSFHTWKHWSQVFIFLLHDNLLQSLRWTK